MMLKYWINFVSLLTDTLILSVILCQTSSVTLLTAAVFPLLVFLIFIINQHEECLAVPFLCFVPLQYIFSTWLVWACRGEAWVTVKWSQLISLDEMGRSGLDLEFVLIQVSRFHHSLDVLSDFDKILPGWGKTNRIKAGWGKAWGRQVVRLWSKNIKQQYPKCNPKMSRNQETAKCQNH